MTIITVDIFHLFFLIFLHSLQFSILNFDKQAAFCLEDSRSHHAYNMPDYASMPENGQGRHGGWLNICNLLIQPQSQNRGDSVLYFDLESWNFYEI